MVRLPRSPSSITSPYLWMLGGAAAFSIMGFLTGIARDYCDWQYIAIARTSVALFLATALTLSAGAKLVFFRPAKLWMRSIAGSISLVANFYALTHLPVSEVLTVTNMFPLWVAVLSWPLLGMRPSWDILIAACVGVAGVALVQQPHFHDGGVALAAAILSSFTSAVALIGLHQLKGLDSRAVVAHFSAVSLVFCLAAALFLPHDGPPLHASAAAVPTVQQASMFSTTVMLLGGLAVAATAGQIMLTKAFAAGPPARVSVVNLSQVGMAAGLEVLLLGRTFSWVTLVGMALVIAPTAWVLLRKDRHSSAPGPSVSAAAKPADACRNPPREEVELESSR